MATTIADLETRIKALEGKEAEAGSPFVGFVLNNWETRPALILATHPNGSADLVVFTLGAADGAENEHGYMVVTGAKRNDKKHAPGTWHLSEPEG